MIVHLIEPQFQPIVSASGEVLSYESLLRLRNQRRDTESIIKGWEASGLIVDMDVAMIRAVRSAVHHIPDMPISLNVSPATLSSASDAYLEALSELGCECRPVIVELTERVRIDSMRTVLHFARECKNMRVGISLDDCRPGHMFANPLLLQELKPTYVKIDGGYLKEVFAGARPEPLRAIVAIAKNIGASVIAEHIETLAIRDFALSAGVEFLQGYLTGRPCSAEAAIDHFLTRNKYAVL